jgi:hypothetical protein
MPSRGEASGAAHRAMRRMSGKRILESWNCLMLTRLQAAAGTVAVLMICMHGARTRCREAISCSPARCPVSRPHSPALC